MLSIMVVIVVMIFMYFAIALQNHHPFLNRIQTLLRDFDNTLMYGTYVQIYDLSTPARTERLFIIAPENVVLYNFDKTLYYYLDSANVFCPNEFTVTKFTSATIQTVNDTGVYSTACTSVGSLTLIEHFAGLKNNTPDYMFMLDAAEQIQFTIMDIINYLIYNGYVDLGVK
ncbi:occlusion-derived virus envelope protein [Condylorrhiza vestigialis mutiple nucleopolyhedrovirus]|uniref:Occlusion-derived virus envelope protein n=1 Tax=Condylorrhiza vestigialis mutiple nucleopolyhedrovirus TaxID=1592576 RepID=A0A0B4UKV0_9ABAC|nr:occlusion-derived virus envelope protein [Condylorrhiza vestigialis mutiple nucleopolyhedrovirus]AJD09219.1 occlusion-derived virus envelope protein [Condylorrhiza vestigialis mutiple nucleopolyhedrovirus]